MEDYQVFIHDIVCAKKVSYFDINESLKFLLKKKIYIKKIKNKKIKANFFNFYLTFIF